jgi:hypothetical protein
MALILDGTNGLSDVDGSAATPAIRGSDANTGIFFPAADTIAFAEGGVESMRLDSAGNVGVGITPNAWAPSGTRAVQVLRGSLWHDSVGFLSITNNAFYDGANWKYIANQFASQYAQVNSTHQWFTAPEGTAGNNVTFTERARIDSSGNLLVGKTAIGTTTTGIEARADGFLTATRSGQEVMLVNRLASDGTLVSFQQANITEGSISVSGTTVSYNGGHLARWAQTTTAKDESLVKGTVLSNLDEMNVYVDADGNPVENEQLNKVKVSDVEGDANVAGVFVNWEHDEAHNVDEINMAMTGDMIIRIAQGVTVQRGDLLMSAGDGTAKPQGDDIVRSKTIAKVTSTHVTCTYADGSFCVPCVLMAC